MAELVEAHRQDDRRSVGNFNTIRRNPEEGQQGLQLLKRNRPEEGAEQSIASNFIQSLQARSH